MSFAEVNKAIKTGGGSWVNPKKVKEGFKGFLVDVKVRDAMFNNAPQLSKKGNIRKEWVITFRDDEGEIKNIGLKEGGQIALTSALEKMGAELEPEGYLQGVIVKAAVQGKSGAEWKFKYTPPAPDAGEDDPFGDDDDEAEDPWGNTPPPGDDDEEEDPFA